MIESSAWLGGSGSSEQPKALDAGMPSSEWLWVLSTLPRQWSSKAKSSAQGYLAQLIGVLCN